MSATSDPISISRYNITYCSSYNLCYVKGDYDCEIQLPPEVLLSDGVVAVTIRHTKHRGNCYWFISDGPPDHQDAFII
jgi:hypothetical protein